MPGSAASRMARVVGDARRDLALQIGDGGLQGAQQVDLGARWPVRTAGGSPTGAVGAARSRVSSCAAVLPPR